MRRPCDTLTERERDIINAITLGDTNAMIALRLSIAFTTAHKYVSRILDKLGMDHRMEVAQWRLQQKWVSPPQCWHQILGVTIHHEEITNAPSQLDRHRYRDGSGLLSAAHSPSTVGGI